MGLKLGKVNRGLHLPALVASSISRKIAQGRLQPGDRLPTEHALATTFGVSRNVVREAIAKLRSEGRVWSHQGRGAFVADTTNPTVLSIDHDALQKGDAFSQLVRTSWDSPKSTLLHSRSVADRKMISPTCRTRSPNMTASPYGSGQWLKEELKFHTAIARATANAYIVQFIGFVSKKAPRQHPRGGRQPRLRRNGSRNPRRAREDSRRGQGRRSSCCARGDARPS